MRIRTAIFGVYVAACAIGFLVLMHFMLAEVRPRYLSALRHNLEGSARLLAAALHGRDPASLQPDLLHGRAEFRVRLLDENGTVLLDTSERIPTDAAEYADKSVPSLMKRAASGLLDDHQTDAPDEIAGTAGWLGEKGRVGTVIVSRSIRGVNAVIWAERKKLAAVGLLIAAVMLIAGWWIATKLTDSIERLTIYAQAVRDGRPATVPRSKAHEIAKLTTAFEEMRESLEGRQQLERYTLTLAHEVKAPLSAIRGAAELLEEEMTLGQKQQFLHNIRSEAARIQRIIERLLELTSLEARRTLKKPEEIEAVSLTAEVAETMRPAFAAQQVALLLEPVTDFRLRGERFLLRQALINLLQNALEFSSAGMAVRLSATQESGMATFTIEDEGPGVPGYALGKVFDRFYSLPRPGSGTRSTGIGLALVAEIAHLHGGTATLANRSSVGARARLSIPAERAV
jgi:two-component system sensor histidine kinase CreC